MPVTYLLGAVVSLVPPKYTVGHYGSIRTIGRTGAVVQTTVHIFGVVLGKDAVGQRGTRHAIIGHAGTFHSCVSSKHTADQSRGAHEIIVHGPALTRTTGVISKGTVYKSGAGKKIIAHGTAPSLGVIIGKGAVDHSGSMLISCWRPTLGAHIVHARALGSVVVLNDAVPHGGITLKSEYAGSSTLALRF